MSEIEDQHDWLCLPGVSPVPREKCIYCILITRAREEERNDMANVSNGDLVIQAYVRGREDAAVAVREFPVNSVLFLPSDTPLSMAVRVKEILSVAAIGSPVKDNNGE